MSTSSVDLLGGAAAAPSPQDVPAGPPEPSGADVAQLRLQRLNQHLVEVLQQPDAMRANLGATANDLLTLGYRLKEAIDRRLSDPSDPLAQFENLTPAIEAYLKVTRQVDRLANLDHQMANAKSTAMPGNPR